MFQERDRDFSRINCGAIVNRPNSELGYHTTARRISNVLRKRDRYLPRKTIAL